MSPYSDNVNDKKSFSLSVIIKTIPSCSANQHHIPHPVCVHIIALNLQRIINLLKCHKFQTNLLGQEPHTYISFQCSLCIIDIAKKFWSQHVLICMVHVIVSIWKIVFHYNFLLDTLVFVCDCCWKFQLPFGAVSQNLCSQLSIEITKR